MISGRSEPVVLVLGSSSQTSKPFVISPEINLPATAYSPAIKKTTKKKAPEPEWRITPSTDLSQLGNHYLMLSKFRLTCKISSIPGSLFESFLTISFVLALVVITTMGGYAMAPAPFELTTFILCSLGTGLCSAAANSINQYHEVPFDGQMSRTKNRVLVKGLLTPLHAIGFATVAASTGISMLYFGVNGLTAALGAANLILYTSIYTPMKRFSILNTWVGSIGMPFFAKKAIELRLDFSFSWSCSTCYGLGWMLWNS